MSDDPFDWSAHKGGNEDRPPIWKADAIGAKIAGTITELWVYEDAKKGTATPVLNLDTDDGPQSVWASQVLLRQALADQDPQIGDHVSIEFTGSRPTKSGSGMMKEFDVVVRVLGVKVAAHSDDAPPPEDEFGEEPF